LLRNNESRVDRNDDVGDIVPFRIYRDCYKIPGRSLQDRRLPNAAESAILPSGIAVPVSGYKSKAGNQYQSEGRSTAGAPVWGHSVSIIDPKSRLAATFISL
jgi:hypothetical protein